MALAAGFGLALRTESELNDLISAIVKADPEDELDWIEWKREFDFSNKASQGTLARHVLGMANRRPEQAILRAGGCGYVVIGAEPGNRCGVSPVDPAILTKGIRPYLGSEGPVWSHTYVPDSVTSVLVITVEPPVLGARIFTLQPGHRFGRKGQGVPGGNSVRPSSGRDHPGDPQRHPRSGGSVCRTLPPARCPCPDRPATPSAHRDRGPGRQCAAQGTSGR
jgi:hypothetical protein